MNQKNLYWANLEPVAGNEQGGKRPVLIISGNTMNRNFNLVIVCPVSAKVKNYENCVVLKKNKINNLKSDSEVLTFQCRAISKTRLYKKIGRISDEQFLEITQGLIDVMTY